MPKRSVVIQSKARWKPVEIEPSTVQNLEWEGFSGLEELTSYDIVRQEDSSKRSTRTPDKPTKKKKRKRKQASKPAGTSSDSVHKSAEASTNVVSDDVESDDEGVEHPHEKKLKCESPDMSAWLNCHVPEPVLRALAELNFTEPTEIQAQTLPAAIRDHLDIMGAAETGSGKTLAFGIPLLHHIMERKSRLSAEGDTKAMPLQALVLTPTRELAIQVTRHIQDVAKYTNVRIVNVVGGLSAEKQLRLLKRKPEIVVATPGRLWELVDQGAPHVSDVSKVRYLVIDEADRMVEKGHFEDLTRLLDIMNAPSEDGEEKRRRQNFVFSATLTMVHDLPRRLKNKPKKRKLSEKEKVEELMHTIGISSKPKVVDLTRKLGTAELLCESRIVCPSVGDKDSRLYYFLLSHPGRTLVFCNSIDSVRRLVSVLDLLQRSPLPLHASMQQRQRLKNLDRFKNNPSGLLLATDVAARGLDIQGIQHVIHFQVPRTAEVYVHRSGRTARAKSGGLSVMLMEPGELHLYRKICKTLNRNEDLPDFPIDLSMLKAVQKRVDLARKLEAESHRVRRTNYEDNWLQRAAKEMEIDLDERMLSNTDEKKKADTKRKLKAMQFQLSEMLKKPLFPPGFSGKYLTKQGALEVPKVRMDDAALEAMEEWKKKKNAMVSPAEPTSKVKQKKKAKRFTLWKQKAVSKKQSDQ
uniref:ATP-dependent RNA helicase n=1 Tax=Rhipicephalus pulchellus TaxID=72859 RepID=L7M9T5_RHIPC